MINDPFNDDDKTKSFLQQYNNNNQISIECGVNYSCHKYQIQIKLNVIPFLWQRRLF